MGVVYYVSTGVKNVCVHSALSCVCVWVFLRPVIESCGICTLEVHSSRKVLPCFSAVRSASQLGQPVYAYWLCLGAMSIDLTLVGKKW